METVGGRPSERFSWLRLAWFAGERHDPVQRWVVWEVLPLPWLLKQPGFAAQAEETLAALRGPPPRSLRRWTVRRGVRRWTSESVVTQEQWDQFRETGCVARLFWVVQGAHGGHKQRFTLQEEQLLRLHGLPGAAPPMGALPYAPWDNRVRVALGRHRELHDEAIALAATRDHRLIHLTERKLQERRVREGLLEWLRPQVRGFVEQHGKALAKLDLPVDDRAASVPDDAAEATETTFLNETATTV